LYVNAVQRQCYYQSKAQIEAAESKIRVDTAIPNVDDPRAVYQDLKEAISALSPIVRNRLHGIPQYILEYSDLVISNQVEKPFLMPILVSGPVAGEKWTLLQTVADEFPDVFAFPALYTDEQAAPPADPDAERCELVPLVQHCGLPSLRTVGLSLPDQVMQSP
jgi:hypothetical protein